MDYKLPTAGLDDIAFVKTLNDDIPIVRKVIVGSFGIKGGGEEIRINWVVSRKNRKHGYDGSKEPFSRHSRQLLDSMFRGWK